jgi:hypothetical protein
MDLKKTLKVLTGIIIVPMGIMAFKLWPWWEKQHLPLKIISGVFVLPFMLIAAITSSWWDGY